MRLVKSNKKLGKELRRLREKQKMPLVVAIEYLKDLKIQCSKPNLAKIELGDVACRADILAGLCHIYEVDINEVVYN